MSSATDRRGFFRSLLTGFSPAAPAAAPVVLAGQRGSLGILRPPGALEESRFAATCDGCKRCVEVCEPGCIEFFGPEAGELAGTPYILPAQRACTLCLLCGPVCPTGALQPVAAKADVAMGVAVVDEQLCVSHTGEGICGACHTMCPLKNRAITQSWRNQPYVQDACVGCGLCEEACIAEGARAIRVHVRQAPAAEAA